MNRKTNIIFKLWNKITIEQWKKALRLVMICMIFMVISEAVFEIPTVENFFGEGLINGREGWIVYAIIWLVMFAQVAIIPIPALPILIACTRVEMLQLNEPFHLLLFTVFVTSATVLGAIASYWIGRAFGKPAIKWVAGSEEDYNKWCNKFNTKTGKWIYGATVLLPIFPDDLISLVVGSIKMNFAFYVFANIIGKFIGLYCTMYGILLLGLSAKPDGFPIALVIYTIILIAAIIIYWFINRSINRNQDKTLKLETAKEDILHYMNKKESAAKDLIIDYKINKKLKTYLATKIKIYKVYEVNSLNNKNKIRIIIECRASDYYQIIFDKKYKLTTTYQELLKDLENI